MKNYSLKRAFTLAEVLITLGIIGVVAALTIPTLIANYTKKQTVTKLKQTYSMLSQALTMAQAEHGDTSTWNVNNIYGTNTDGTGSESKEMITEFLNDYLFPNIKVSHNYGYTNWNSIGYDGVYFPLTDTKRNAAGYIFSMTNDVLILSNIGTSGCQELDSDGNCIRWFYTNIMFTVDVNGFKKPNCYGKDIFIMKFDVRDKKFGFHNYSNGKRESNLEACKLGNGETQVCGYVIFADGWKISDDYPWL